MCAMLMASRKVIEGVAWVRQPRRAPGADVAKLVEKGKSQFVGPEISGKMLGVIGLGAIGVHGGQHRHQAGHGPCYGYDPYPVGGRRPGACPAWSTMPSDLETIYKNCDYITLHVPSDCRDQGNAQRRRLRT